MSEYEFRWAKEAFFAALVAAGTYVVQGALSTDLATVADGRQLAVSLAAGAGRIFFAALMVGLAKVGPKVLGNRPE